jgi:hypothetical protein
MFTPVPRQNDDQPSNQHFASRPVTLLKVKFSCSQSFGEGQVMTVTSTVSNYGKTRTSTFKGKDAQGRDVNNIVVYDKQ